MNQLVASLSNAVITWPCSCEHCLSVAASNLTGIYGDFKCLSDRDKSKVTHQHQRDTCPKCGKSKMIESKLCRTCYRENTKAEYRVCENCNQSKSVSQFLNEDSKNCFQCQKKIDRQLARAIKASERASASICECGKTKLPESKRCRTCGAALAGAAKLAKLAATRDYPPTGHPPIELPKSLRGRRPRPMRNLGKLEIVNGYRALCMLCSKETWVAQIPNGRVRCECGGGIFWEPESRKVWK